MDRVPKEIKRWDRYTPGEVSWINANIDHPARQVFIDYAVKNAQSILEVGPGELIEYQKIKDRKPIDYTIADISKPFLNNACEKFPEIKCIESYMEDVHLYFKPKTFDVVFLSSVLEHSWNIKRAVKMIRTAKKFHFVLFKWHFKGSLISLYRWRKKYYSTPFNIDGLVHQIKKHGIIEYMDIITPQGERLPFSDYRINKIGMHRNGTYLMIHGRNKNGISKKSTDAKND